MFFQGGGQAQGRLAEWFIGEAESAPVHAGGAAAAGVEKRLHGLLGIHVHRPHDVARLVGADGNHGEVDGAVARADFAEGLAVAAVTSVPEGAAAACQEPAAPMGAVAIMKRAGGEMLCGRGGDAHPAAEIEGRVPRQFHNVLETPVAKQYGVPLRHEQAGLRPELAQRRQIEVIVVGMGEEDGVDGR